MVKVRSVRTTSSRIVLELEKPKRVTKFKPSAKEKNLTKIAKEAIEQLRKSYDEIETERVKYDNQIKKLKGEVSHCRSRYRVTRKALETHVQKDLIQATPNTCFEHKISKVKLQAVENLLKKVGAGPSLVRTSKGVYNCVTNSPDIMAKQSKTIAAGIIHYSTDPKMTWKEKQEFCKVSGVSIPTIYKITHLIQEHLSSSIRR